MSRKVVLGCLAGLAALALPVAAQVNQRLLRLEEGGARRALIVGNQAYPQGPLKNPVADAHAVGKALGAIGFQTEILLDADLRTLSRAVDSFVVSLQTGDIAFFFYAGHGVQIGGENYLVPVDFDSKDEADAPFQSYSVSRLHDRMEAAGARLNLIVLDACRNNPFRATRSTGGGLAAMNTGKGTFIAFATAPGRTASDNPNGANGLYTTYLVEALRQPGLTLDQVFNQTRQRVYQASNQAQLPWTGSSVIGEFYFVPPRAAAPQVQPQAAPQVQPQAASQIQPQAAPQAQPQAAPQVQPQAAPQVQPQAAPQVKSQTTPQVTPQAAPQSTPPQPAAQEPVRAAQQASPVPAAELVSFEEQFTLLSARAAAVRGSIQTLRRSQQASGLSLRGDIDAADRLMENYMSQTQAALQKKDAAAAARQIQLAERQVVILEKFLGR